jgi:hypothetical protein
MNEDEPFLRRRNVKDEEEVEILDETQQQKIINEIERDYQQLAMQQNNCIVVFGGFLFALLSIISFMTQDYMLFFLPGLASGALSAMVVIKAEWAFTVSLSIETLALLGLVQYWPNRPIIQIVVIHVLYAILFVGRIWSIRFARSYPAQIRHLESLKYSVKLA